MARRSLVLTGNWEFREVEPAEVAGLSARQLPTLTSRGWRSCELPGTTLEHLLAHKVLPHPLQGSNDLRWQPVEKAEFLYRCTFDLGETWQSLLMEDYQRMELVFDQLDCFAHVYLNGVLMGSTDNAFHPHRFDVTEQLKANRNELVLHFESALNRGAQIAREQGIFPAAFDGTRVHTRRPAWKTGSRFAPRLSTPALGAVELQHIQQVRLRDAVARVEEITSTSAKILLDLGVESLCEQTLRLEVQVECRAPKSAGGKYSSDVVATLDKTLNLKAGRFQFQQSLKIREPKFWWPLGYGDPGRRPLYIFRIAIRRDDELCDSKSFQFGLRRVQAAEEENMGGAPFRFNQGQLYLRGTTILPISCMSLKDATGGYGELAEQLATANVNCVRIWGGGSYAPTAFLNACDELGILVIHEFPFSQANYPEEKDFWRNVQTEASYWIREHANHPSLVLWVGKDGPLDYGEVTQFKGSGETRHRLFRSLLPQLVETLDGTRPYVKTLFLADDLTTLNTADLSTARLHTLNAFLSSTLPFVPAYGLPSLPGIRTTQFAETPNPDGGPLHTTTQETAAEVMQGVIDWCGEPRTPEELHYLSQWIQGQILSRGIDHWRSQRPGQQGLLHWHFNDCAPGMSSSVVDYMREPKLSFWAMREAQSPVSILFETTPELVHVMIDAQPGDWEGAMPMTCRLKTYHVSGRLIGYKDEAVRVEPNGCTKVGSYTLQALQMSNPRETVLAAELFKGSKHVIASRMVSLLKPREMKLAEPELTAKLDFVLAGKRAIYLLRSKNLIRGVELSVDRIPGAKLRHENGFDIWPSREVWVQVLIDTNTPGDQLLQGLRFRCLNDLYGDRPINWRPLVAEVDPNTPLALSREEQDMDSQTLVTRLRTTDVIPKLFDSSNPS
jgi:beta-mannosidase